MQKIFEQIKNRQYFDAHFPTIKKDNRIATGGQFLSFATESIVFSTIVYNTFGELMPAWQIFGVTVEAGRVTAIILGMSFALLLEVAIKNRTTDVVKGMLKITKVDALPFRILFLICLYAISGLTSFMGAKLIAEKVVPVTRTESPGGIDSLYFQKLTITNKSFASDSALLAANYNQKIKAVRMAAAAQVAQQTRWIHQFKAREIAEKKRFTTKIAAHQANISKYKAAKAARISEIETEKAAAIFTAHQSRTTTLSAAEGVYNKHQNNILASNEKATAKRETAVFLAGNSLAAFTLSMLAYLFFATRQNEKFLRDAGVIYKIHLSDHELSGGVLNEALHIFAELLSNKIRRPLYAMANRHKDKQKKMPENKSYYFSAWNEFTDATQQHTIVQTQPLQPAAGAVGTMPKTAKPKPNNVAVIPIEPTATRNPYGGRIGVIKPTAKDRAKPTANGHQRPTAGHICSRKGCNTEYKKTVWNKRFCSEVCKVAAWEEKHRRKVYKKPKRR